MILSSCTYLHIPRCAAHTYCCSTVQACIRFGALTLQSVPYVPIRYRHRNLHSIVQPDADRLMHLLRESLTRRAAALYPSNQVSVVENEVDDSDMTS